MVQPLQPLLIHNWDISLTLSPLMFCSPSGCHTLSPKLLRLLQLVLQAATDTKCCRTSTSTHCVREPHQPTSCKSLHAALGLTCSSWVNAGGALFVPRNRHPSTTVREQGIQQAKKKVSILYVSWRLAAKSSLNVYHLEIHLSASRAHVCATRGSANLINLVSKSKTLKHSEFLLPLDLITHQVAAVTGIKLSRNMIK